MTLTDIIGFYLRYGPVLPPIMLIVALYTSWQGLWYWARDVVDLQKRLNASEHELASFRLRYDYVVQEKEEYKAAALYGVQVIRTRVPSPVADTLPALPHAETARVRRTTPTRTRRAIIDPATLPPTDPTLEGSDAR